VLRFEIRGGIGEVNVLFAALRSVGKHVAHGEESYSAADANLNTLERNRQVIFLSHFDVKTSMTYTHVLGLGVSGVRRPFDVPGCPEDDSPSRQYG
jgi:hypothetical protein